MAKTKFFLTNDLVKVEPEPPAYKSPVQQVQVQPTMHQGSAQHVPHGNSVEVDANALSRSSGEWMRDHHEGAQPVKPYPVAPNNQQVQGLEPHVLPNVLPDSFSSIVEAHTGEQSFQQEPFQIRQSTSQEPLQTSGSEVNQVIRDQFNLKISREIKRDFRIFCLRQNVSMTDALEEALCLYIKSKENE